MSYKNLPEFLYHLEQKGQLRRIQLEVDPKLEITEICHRTLCANGPALLFENPKGFNTPVLGNLFGSTDRIAMGLGLESIEGLREIGKILAFLKEPKLPTGARDLITMFPAFKRLADVNPKFVNHAPCQDWVIEGNNVDLSTLPIQTCWPDDVGPLITWGLVTTRGPYKERQNLGIYRQQVIGRNKVILRWLQHRGGALDFREWQEANPGQRFPVAVAIGADPATLLAAVTPIPDSLSEFQFAGLLRGQRSEVIKCLSHDLYVPASAEFVLEGFIEPGEQALEGPFGDHTGYYNVADKFPVLTIERITHKEHPIYHSTYMGRSPEDEPSQLAMVLNEIFIPILQMQFPEIVDFYLPPEACSYRMAVVSIKKRYLGHAKRIMFGIWSMLNQFNYTKFIIITDDDINIRKWSEVVWAITTRMDPGRDTIVTSNTPIDYLDFASPEAGLGSKMGFDATNKWPGETNRQWGRPITMSAAVKSKIDSIWEQLNVTDTSFQKSAHSGRK